MHIGLNQFHTLVTTYVHDKNIFKALHDKNIFKACTHIRNTKPNILSLLCTIAYLIFYQCNMPHPLLQSF